MYVSWGRARNDLSERRNRRTKAWSYFSLGSVLCDGSHEASILFCDFVFLTRRFIDGHGGDAWDDLGPKTRYIHSEMGR